MQFILDLSIEPDVSRKDVALALRRVAAALERTDAPFEEGDTTPIRSPEGKRIGQWEIAS